VVGWSGRCGAVYPGGQLSAGAFPGREQAAVEGHKHRVQGRGDRSFGALADGGDRSLPDRLGVRTGMPSLCRWKALCSDGQGVQGCPQLLSGGVDTAQPLGKLVGAFGLGPVGQKPAGLPA
jgi:hypothetical protein